MKKPARRASDESKSQVGADNEPEAAQPSLERPPAHCAICGKLRENLKPVDPCALCGKQLEDSP